MNSEDLYVIVVAVVVCTAESISVPTYYFADSSTLKCSDEEMCQYTAVRPLAALGRPKTRRLGTACCYWWHPEGRHPALERAAAASWHESSGTRTLFRRCMRLIAAGPHSRGDCDVVVIEVWVKDNVPVALMNREGLYVIVAMLKAPDPGVPCVLTYSFANYRPKRDDQNMPRYIVAFCCNVQGGRRHAPGYNLLLLVASSWTTAGTQTSRCSFLVRIFGYELRPRDNVPVMLMNREGLYVIIAVLAVSNLGCACVLMWSFANYNRLKWRAKNTCLCSAAPSTVARMYADNDRRCFFRQLRGARGTMMIACAIVQY
ncbi:hypothetical protein MRX96_016444 [Rhipicephalus microplus]